MKVSVDVLLRIAETVSAGCGGEQPKIEVRKAASVIDGTNLQNLLILMLVLLSLLLLLLTAVVILAQRLSSSSSTQQQIVQEDKILDILASPRFSLNNQGKEFTSTTATPPKQIFAEEALPNPAEVSIKCHCRQRSGDVESKAGTALSTAVHTELPDPSPFTSFIRGSACSNMTKEREERLLYFAGKSRLSRKIQSANIYPGC